MLETLSDSQMRSVLDGIACAAFVVNVEADGGFRYVGINATHTASSGVTLPMVQGRRPHECLPPEMADAVCERYRSCIEARAAVRYEQRLVARDPRWWSTALMPLFDADGRVCRIFGTAFDITAQKSLEAELRQSRGFLQTVIDHVPLPIFCKDVEDLRYAFVNRAVAQLVGEGQAIVGATDFDLYPTDQAAGFQARDREVLASGEPMTIEAEVVTTPGGDRLLRTRKLPIAGPDGEPKWLLGVSEDETERRGGEEALAAANDFLQAMLDSMPIMIVCKDAADLRYTLLNRAGEYYFGRPREEVVGRLAGDIFPPYWAEEFERRDRAALADGGPVTALEVIETKDGPRRVRSTKVAIRGPDGSPRHLLGISEDVTESHRAEARLRDAIESLQDGFVLFDKDDRIVLHNARFLEFYPHLRAMLPLEGKTFQETLRAGVAWRTAIMPREEAEVLVAGRIANWRGGAQDAFEQRVPGGRWVLVSERLTADGGVVGIHTDITAQKLAEMRLVDAIESIDQGFILCGTDDRVILSNRRIREMSPTVGPDMVPGMEVRDLIRRCEEAGDYRPGPQSIEESVETIFQLYRSGTVEGIERQLRDGRWILFSQHVTQNGLRVGLRTDITLMKAREQQLTDVRDHLQRQTAELMRLTVDLRLARQRAEDASRAKSQFLAMISHELRTPFTGIRGMADLLAGTGLDGDQLRYLDVMRRSIERLLALLDQLLDFSRIEAGRIEIAETPMAPARLLADAAATFAAGAEAKGVALDHRVAADVPAEVTGDPAKTTQILANLVGNAVKFTEQGRILLTLAVEPEGGEQEGGERFLRWTVEDTGIGLSAAEMGRLFEPFTQADGSTSRRFGGTGLGLAISRRLAEAMGGTIGVASIPGQGASFWFRTPMHAARRPVPEAAPPPGPAAVEIAAVATGRSRRVLVAEDDSINQLLIDTMLKRWGFETTVVGDGQAALDRLAVQAFDVVLMDVNMPVMDGPTAVRSLRAGGGPMAAVPVFALTADVLPDHVAGYRRAGFTDVMTKPVDWARLRALLEAIPAA